MAKASRDKGKRGELEVRDLFRAFGFDVDRVPNSGGLRLKGDLYGDCPHHIEVKRQETALVWKWIAQAEDECDGKPWAVFFRRSRSHWYALIPAEDLIALLAGAPR